MEDLVMKLLEQAPSTAAVIITVVLFLRQQNRQSLEWHKHAKLVSDQAKDSHDDCATVVKENTKVLSKVEKLLELRIKEVGG